jgi:hypothetical protein
MIVICWICVYTKTLYAIPLTLLLIYEFRNPGEGYLTILYI